MSLKITGHLNLELLMFVSLEFYLLSETCELENYVRIESRIELAATIQIRIESADSCLQLQC